MIKNRNLTNLWQKCQKMCSSKYCLYIKDLPELLQKCVSDKTQTVNKSIHSVIWKKCPKETFVSLKRFELAVISSISEFNLSFLNAFSTGGKKKRKKKFSFLSTIGSKFIRDLAMIHAIFLLFDCQFLSPHPCSKQYKA